MSVCLLVDICWLGQLSEDKFYSTFSSLAGALPDAGEDSGKKDATFGSIFLQVGERELIKN